MIYTLAFCSIEHKTKEEERKFALLGPTKLPHLDCQEIYQQ